MDVRSFTVQHTHQHLASLLLRLPTGLYQSGTTTGAITATDSTNGNVTGTGSGASMTVTP